MSAALGQSMNAMRPGLGTSPIYFLFAWSIENRARIHCLYDGLPREICPIILGHSGSEEKALVWQIDGETSGGPLLRPDWKCFFLANVSDAEWRDGKWEAGSRHQQRQSCVRVVDYDVNELSPYDPTRSLGNLRGVSLPRS